MERLTREETIMVGGREKAACNHENDDCNDSCMYGRCRWQEKANMLLKEYEDTGLTPAEIMELKERDTAMEINEIHVDEYYCPVCGAENNCDQGVVEDNFCPRCGQRLKVRED